MSKFSHPNVAAKKARDAFRKVAPKVAADETRDIHRKIAAQFEEFRDTQVPDSMRGLAKRNVAETRGLYERSKKTLQAVLESWEKSFGAAAQDAVALNRKAIDIAERSINSGFDFTASLAGAKNLAAPAIKLKESWQIAKSIALCAKGRLLTKTPLVLHHNVYTDETPNILIPMFCWPNRGRFSRPKNLAIMLVHNRDYKTRLEQSLDYLGIQGYSVVRPCLPRGEWTHSVKIPAFLSFAQSCEEDYILYIDSDDAILLGDPQRALGLLRKSGAEILFSTTSYKGYELMPELEGRFRQLADDAGWSSSEYVHLNSGVFIGRRKPMIEFLQEATKFVTDNDLSPRELKTELKRKRKGGVMPEWKRRGGVMPDFPKGCGCDQQIFRFLYPRFAETLRLDYSGRLGTLPKRKALGSIVRRSRRALRKAYGVSTSANMRNV